MSMLEGSGFTLVVKTIRQLSDCWDLYCCIQPCMLSLSTNAWYDWARKSAESVPSTFIAVMHRIEVIRRGGLPCQTAE